jgi:hypothetical protein
MSAEYPDLLILHADARRRVPDDRHIWCTTGYGFEPSVATRRALILGGVWCPQYLRGPNPWQVNLSKPRLITTAAIGDWKDWLPLMEDLVQAKTPLLLATGDIDPELLQVLLVNGAKYTLPNCVIRPDPGGPVTWMGKPPRKADKLPLYGQAWCRRDATAVFPADGDDAGNELSDIKVIEVGGENDADQQERYQFLCRTLSRGRPTVRS